jgi:hypothetical protein
MKFFQARGTRFVSLRDGASEESLPLSGIRLNRLRDEDVIKSRTARFLADVDSMGRVRGESIFIEATDSG